MWGASRIWLFLFAGSMGASCAMSSVPENPVAAVRCSVMGAKWISGTPSEGDVCARFVARLGLAGPSPASGSDASAPADGVSIALHFHSQGRAVADITRYSGGVARTLPTRERAVMDRPLTIDDVDKLADDVAADLGSESQP